MLVVYLSTATSTIESAQQQHQRKETWRRQIHIGHLWTALQHDREENVNLKTELKESFVALETTVTKMVGKQRDSIDQFVGIS
jgi:hypothetical protein